MRRRISSGHRRGERPTADRLPFAFGLTLVRRAEWTAARPPGHRPDPRARYGVETWRARIGEVLPAVEDVWWEVPPGRRRRLPPDDAVAAVHPYGPPALRRRASPTAPPPGGRASPPPSRAR
ncbi:hypothetical protein ACIRD3_27410 [Kitasatospora sp. NPDC093550]|uniref:hypothetical protein n=1 Tax=Kitasatospora sp. NPDC093550 TaxID=3364089 RepID=UPI00381CAA4F